MGNPLLLLLFNSTLTLDACMLKCVKYLEVTKIHRIFASES